MPLIIRIANNWNGVVANGETTVLARTQMAARALQVPNLLAENLGESKIPTFRLVARANG